jgi:hypothetical protein
MEGSAEIQKGEKMSKSWLMTRIKRPYNAELIREKKTMLNLEQ